jgi:two-component system, chemotaxis family, response regulator Rcp1
VGRTVRLLVVEDSEGYLELIREAFRHCKGGHIWDLTVATDGEKALTLILGAEKAGSYAPDIILLDWNLPKISGSEVLQRVKAHPELRKIPILVFSTSAAERDIHEAYRHHANGYITKPTELEVLFRVAEAIENFWVAIAQLTSFKPDRPSRAPTPLALP